MNNTAQTDRIDLIAKTEIIPDIFRQEYKSLSNDQKMHSIQFKAYAQDLYNKFEQALVLKPDPRMMALAKTNLEQAVMWAIKAIT